MRFEETQEIWILCSRHKTNIVRGGVDRQPVVGRYMTFFLRLHRYIVNFFRSFRLCMNTQKDYFFFVELMLALTEGNHV